MLKEVVFSETGKSVKFQASGEVGGVKDTLGKWKGEALGAPTVEFTTVTLADILGTARAPQLIHFISLDIEGAELEALKAFPFDTHRIGALAVEHNDEEPKRSAIEALMRRHGYRRVHSWYQDDFYLPEKGGGLQDEVADFDETTQIEGLGETERPQRTACDVDQVPVAVHQHHLRVGPERVHDCPNGSRQQPIVGVQPRDDLT